MRPKLDPEVASATTIDQIITHHGAREIPDAAILCRRTVEIIGHHPSEGSVVHHPNCIASNHRTGRSGHDEVDITVVLKQAALDGRLLTSAHGQAVRPPTACAGGPGSVEVCSVHRG
jgi:hypothetical protein